MSRLPASLGAAFFLGSVLNGTVAAQQSSIEGTWQQVATNAGTCPSCRIEVTREGGTFAIVANNGWSASIGEGRKMGLLNAEGTGAWLTGAGGWTAGRPFDLAVQFIGERLYVGMRVKMPDGSVRTVNAVFKRVWLGV